MAVRTFTLVPLPPFRLDLTVWTLRRRARNSIDRWDGHVYRRVLPLQSGPVEAGVSQIGPREAPALRVAIDGHPLGAAVKAQVSSALNRLLGLDVNLEPFYRFAAGDRMLGDLAERFEGMKPPRFASVFEAVINAIACQQLSLTVGIELLNRLSSACGREVRVGDKTAHAFPLPSDLAAQSISSLRELGFSAHKGRAMIELARFISEGSLNLEALASLPDDLALEQLQDLRGVGRWTAEYVLLRGLGRLDMFPGDDVGARNNLRKWLGAPEPLDYEGVRSVLGRWRPFGGMIYFHLLLDRLADAGCVTAPAPRRRRSRPVIGNSKTAQANSRAGDVSHDSPEASL